MFEYIEGTLQAIVADAAILDVGGMGYRVYVSKTCPSRTAAQGQKLKLYIDFIIRDDAHILYGFATSQDRDLFRLLQNVNGIGPKLALNILSHIASDELAAILFRKDIKALCFIPGIGKKLAERLIVELHERIADFMTSRSITLHSTTHEAIIALQTLGFSTSEARNAILNVQNKAPHLSSVEEVVQYALSTNQKIDS